MLALTCTAAAAIAVQAQTSHATGTTGRTGSNSGSGNRWRTEGVRPAAACRRRGVSGILIR